MIASRIKCLRVAGAVSLAWAAVATPAGQAGAFSAQAPRPLKVFISADMEGITGVVQPPQLGPTGFEYGKFREIMTGEVLAAIEGARAAGATGFVVADSHGNAQNLLIDALPDDVEVVRGFPRPLSMMQGIDETFQAAAFIGYHASEDTAGAVRGHTFSSARLLGVKLNGQEVSEGIFNAALAGHFGVPVVFVSGDRLAVSQVQQAIPGVEGVVVKEPLGYHSARTLTPARSRQLIRQGVERAIRGLGRVRPYRVQTPIALEVGFKSTIDAERASYLPGLSRAGAHAVRGSFADIVQIVKLLHVLTALEPPQ